MIQPRRGVLIVNPQGIGDVISSIPFVEAVCRWADKQFAVYVALASPSYGELMRAEIPDVIPLYLRRSVAGNGVLSLWSQLRGKIDLVIGIPEISEVKLIALKYALGASYLVAESQPSYGRWMSVAVPRDWSQSFLTALDKIGAALGLSIPLARPRIVVQPKELEWAESVLRAGGIGEHWPLVGLHCGAVVPAKRWPANNFGAVLQILNERFPTVAVASFGSMPERVVSDQARRSAGDVPWLDGIGWTLRQSLAVLAHCDVFISGDTGVMHMAAAAGVKTVSVFGPTSPVRRAPLHVGGAAVYPDTDCHPCYRGKWKRPCDCIQHVAPGVVADLAAGCISSIDSPATQSRRGNTVVLR